MSFRLSFKVYLTMLFETFEDISITYDKRKDCSLPLQKLSTDTELRTHYRSWKGLRIVASLIRLLQITILSSLHISDQSKHCLGTWTKIVGRHDLH